MSLSAYMVLRMYARLRVCVRMLSSLHVLACLRAYTRSCTCTAHFSASQSCIAAQVEGILLPMRRIFVGTRRRILLFSLSLLAKSSSRQEDHAFQAASASIQVWDLSSSLVELLSEVHRLRTLGCSGMRPRAMPRCGRSKRSVRSGRSSGRNLYHLLSTNLLGNSC